MGSESTSVAPASAPPRSNALPHLPALDGLRGLAVVGVLLFHGGFAWATGGFLGVSTFFTLSGFLITNLLVREYDRLSNIELLRFWGRRFRRLLPAALAAIVVIGLVWWRIGTPSQSADLRGDMLGALAYVANWRFLFAGTSYADLFSAPSPLQHYWSLAIEEQFYVVFPLVVLVTMRIGGRRLLAATCTVVAAVSVVLMVAHRHDLDRWYYGTDTRVAELLFGVLLAIWWSGRARTHDMVEARRGRVADLVGLAAIAVIFLAWHRIPQGSSFLPTGGLPLYAFATTTVIYISTRPGWTSAVLSMRWLRFVGAISYGLYLYHWPVFLLLSEERTGLSLWPLFVVRMVVTTAIAVVSYRYLEMPIRRGTFLRTARTAIPAAIAGAGLAVIVALAVTISPPASVVPYADLEVGKDFTTIETFQPPAISSANAARTVYIVGDSGAMDAQPAIGAAFVAAGATEVIYGAGPGFGIGGTIPWPSIWGDVIRAHDPDLVVAMFGGWDVDYVKRNGIEAYERLLDQVVDVVTVDGARLVMPPVMPGGRADVSAIDDAIRRLPERHPGKVFVPKISAALVGPAGGYPRQLTLDDGTVLLLRKTDGWHLCQDGAERIATTIIDQLARIGWSAAPAPGWEDGPWREAGAYDDPVGVCARPA